MYLNVVYFGRGAYGVEAASEAYFGKPVTQLTMAESMILAGCIKNPSGKNGGSPFDPTVDQKQAQDRFDYVKGSMLRLKFMSQQEIDDMKMPTTVQKIDDSKLAAQFGLDTPTGLVVHHVMDEMSKVKKADGSLQFADADGDVKNGVKNGGWKIITTIDKRAQDDAVKAASGTVSGTPLYGQPANLQAALVSVDPSSGAVRAYYGGPNGSGCVYAGLFCYPFLTLCAASTGCGALG